MKYCLPLILAVAIATTALAQTQPPDYWEEEWDHHDWYHEEGYDSPDSPLAVTDGTPQSTSAMVALEVASDAAFLRVDETVELFEEPAPDEAATEVAVQRSAIDIDFGIGSATVGDIDFDLYTVRVPYSRTLHKRGSVSLLVPLSITRAKDVILGEDGVSLGNASIYGGGVVAGYAHRVFIKEDGKPYRWRVSPSAGLFLRESSDLNQGAWVYNLGLSSSFAYRLDEHWVINMGNSLSLAWNSGRKDYPDPIRDNQQVVINGIQVFYLANRWTHHAYVMDTRFLRSSFIDNFQAYAIGTGYRITRSRSFQATLVYENGSRYESIRGMIGTTWKF